MESDSNAGSIPEVCPDDPVTLSPGNNSTAANDDANGNDNVRTGSISSARFNILSTMVGGGCLSLPLAFQQSGNALVGPLMLLATGIVTQFCFERLVLSSRHNNSNTMSSITTTTTVPGTDTFESITSSAFGPIANVLTMGLVVMMCFFGTVGYSVLLRDMVEPLNDWILLTIFKIADDIATTATATDEWWHKNFTMFLVVVLVTPFCTLRRLTALKDCGALSMVSLLILGTCIVVRSVQCQMGIIGTDNDGVDDSTDYRSLFREPGDDTSGGPSAAWYTHLRFFPDSWHDLLNALPLYISCFVCHYNILPVHNELTDPTPKRVSLWLTSTTWFAVALYMVMGFAGSAYAHCTPSGKIQGNILLDFDEHDPLLMVGRMCLAVTITLAFPMLVIPGRDIVVRSLILPRMQQQQQQPPPHRPHTRRSINNDDEELAEPLLEHPHHEEHGLSEGDDADDDNDDDDDDDDAGTTRTTTRSNADSVSFGVLLSISVVLFWSASALASLVSSIDVVWDLLGSSLSILMSYLIPAGTYLAITEKQQATNNNNDDDSTHNNSNTASRIACWLLLGGSIPLMVISTANAVYNTFDSKR